MLNVLLRLRRFAWIQRSNNISLALTFCTTICFVKRVIEWGVTFYLLSLLSKSSALSCEASHHIFSCTSRRLALRRPSVCYRWNEWMNGYDKQTLNEGLGTYRERESERKRNILKGIRREIKFLCCIIYSLGSRHNPIAFALTKPCDLNRLNSTLLQRK